MTITEFKNICNSEHIKPIAYANDMDILSYLSKYQVGEDKTTIKNVPLYTQDQVIKLIEANPINQELIEKVKELRERQASSEAVAWESITDAYKKYITQELYEKFSANVKRWYRPYKCANCTALIRNQVKEST